MESCRKESTTKIETSSFLLHPACGREGLGDIANKIMTVLSLGEVLKHASDRYSTCNTHTHT